MLFSEDIGIDLGTTHTRVCVRGKGTVITEPTVAAVDLTSNDSSVTEIGEKARDMIGRTPGSLNAVSPIKNGVIADYAVTVQLLRKLIDRSISASAFKRTRVMITIPSGTTEVERMAVRMAARDAGARYVSLVESTLADALGENLPIDRPFGTMVADIGGGCTQVAVLALDDIVTSAGVRVGGDDLNAAIIEYVRRNFDLLIGERTAESIKMKIGSAIPYDGEGAVDVRGRSLTDGLPRNIELTSAQVREAMAPVTASIIDMIRSVTKKTPPELLSDIMAKGIFLTGGTSSLRGLARAIQAVTKIPVVVSGDPLSSAVLGLEACLERADR
ncbi:MAG: rod shape-determining protein [Clostridiales bacterium]|nr:rod shape-determining protein [Clostridiales bacterium]